MRLIDQINAKQNRVAAPEPNEVDSKFVMQCLAMDNEGDGMLFAALLENKLLYSEINGSWYVWRGNYWQRDKINTVLGLVRYVTDRYGQEIVVLEERIEKSKKENDKDIHKQLKKAWNKKIDRLEAKIKALRQPRGRTPCLQFASTYYGNPFAIEGSEFDQDPWLLGVLNGVVDLKSGELYPGEPIQLVSKKCSCEYIPLEKIDISPWKQFLMEIYNGDEELILFIQKMLGYGITGLTSEHIFPFFLGRGRNGKSLFLNTLVRVLGDYAAVIPSEMFLKTKVPRTANQTDPAIMKLQGLRFALSSEVEEGSQFSAKEVKRLTGGDPLEGRNPYDKELRNFEPTHLCLMLGNHEPVPPSGDPAFWDRTFLIHHPIRFVKENPDEKKNERLFDPDIEDKLMTMDQQALAWLVEGCMLWQGDGKKLQPPKSVLKATSRYKDDADWIGQFIDACCIRCNKNTSATTLYLAFVEWYMENIDKRKNRTPSQRLFGQKLKGHGEFESKKEAAGFVYQGVSLNADWQNRILQAAQGQLGQDDAPYARSAGKSL